MSRTVKVNYSESPEIYLVITVNQSGDSYSFEYLNPNTGEVFDSIGGLIDNLNCSDARLVIKWQTFLRVIQLVPDDVILESKEFTIDKDGKVVKQEK